MKVLQRVVREAFSMRRKTLRNTLKNLISAEQLEAIGIDTTLRPERLTLQEYVRIADAVCDLGLLTDPGIDESFDDLNADDPGMNLSDSIVVTVNRNTCRSNHCRKSSAMCLPTISAFTTTACKAPRCAVATGLLPTATTRCRK